jgi:hypothetical protein
LPPPGSTRGCLSRPAASAALPAASLIASEPATTLSAFKKFYKIEIVAFLFVFNKYCPIMD